MTENISKSLVDPRTWSLTLSINCENYPKIGCNSNAQRDSVEFGKKTKKLKVNTLCAIFSNSLTDKTPNIFLVVPSQVVTT